MRILLEKEVIVKINQLCVLKNEFEDLFCGVVEPNIYGSIYFKFSEYIPKVGTDKELEYLEDFVQEYFELRSIIVDNRNAMVEYRQSEDYKHENFINKIRIKNEFKYWQQLCNSINQFEEDFYKRTRISLLRVENERWSREKEAEAKETQNKLSEKSDN